MGAAVYGVCVDVLMSGRWRAAAAICCLAVAAGVVWVYARFDPETEWFPKCMVKTLTGFDCPGCGAQRALHALLCGDFAAAWGYNQFLLCLIPLVVVLGAVEVWPHRWPGLRRVMWSGGMGWTMFAAVIIWTVARNVFL